MYSHTPSETILKDTFPKMTVKTCRSSQNISETSNFGEKSFIAKILADLIAKEDAFDFWSEDSSAAAIRYRTSSDASSFCTSNLTCFLLRPLPLPTVRLHLNSRGNKLLLPCRIEPWALLTVSAEIGFVNCSCCCCGLWRKRCHWWMLRRVLLPLRVVVACTTLAVSAW